MMKAGISTASFFLKLYTEDTLPLLNEWGVPVAEVFLTSFSEYGRRFAERVIKGRGQVEINSMHVLNTQFEPQLYAQHPRVKQDAYGWLKEAMEGAKLLGATYYTFHGVARIKRTFREDIARVGRQTQEIFSFCKDYGVTLAYENVEWAFYNRPGIFKQLKEYCPALRGVLDIKQARISGYPYGEYLTEMGESLSHVHVSDLGEDGKMCLPGLGVFNFDELFRRLADVGFQGAVLLENYSGDYRDFGQLKNAYEFLAEKAEKYS